MVFAVLSLPQTSVMQYAGTGKNVHSLKNTNLYVYGQSKVDTHR